MGDTCECSHVRDEHGQDKKHPGSTACRVEDCECIAFEASSDEDGEQE